MTSTESSRPLPRLDEVDLALLGALQDNARTTNAALAREVGLTPPTTLERVRRLEEAGIIRAYRAVLDAEALGYGLTVLLLVQLDHHGREAVLAFRDAVAALDEVGECHYLTGTADFMLKLRVRDVADYRRLLEEEVSRLPHLRHVESAVVLETFKDDGRVVL